MRATFQRAPPQPAPSRCWEWVRSPPRAVESGKRTGGNRAQSVLYNFASPPTSQRRKKSPSAKAGTPRRPTGTQPGAGSAAIYVVSCRSVASPIELSIGYHVLALYARGNSLRFLYKNKKPTPIGVVSASGPFTARCKSPGRRCQR